jgi:AcrR family transcriptional regulator
VEVPDRAPGKRKGRRPGGEDTRGAVLAAAREQFAEHGYDKASVRAIARQAGVDSALVHHFFGTKDQLFRQALEFPLDPRAIIDVVLAGDLDGMGERIARFALSLWEEPVVRTRLLATLRAAATNERAAQMVREFVKRELVEVVAARLDLPDAQLRVELIASQIVGLAMTRYVIGMQPLASAEIEQLIALAGPALQSYLTP